MGGGGDFVETRAPGEIPPLHSTCVLAMYLQTLSDFFVLGGLNSSLSHGLVGHESTLFHE